jgi:hypothetical protein
LLTISLAVLIFFNAVKQAFGDDILVFPYGYGVSPTLQIPNPDLS